MSVAVFTQRNFAILHRKRPCCVFAPPLGSLWATYHDHLRLIGKRV